jgi:hypothetical protein
MPQNLSAQFVCPSPKVLDFNKKRLHWALVVREMEYWHNCDKFLSISVDLMKILKLGFLSGIIKMQLIAFYRRLLGALK